MAPILFAPTFQITYLDQYGPSSGGVDNSHHSFFLFIWLRHWTSIKSIKITTDSIYPSVHHCGGCTTHGQVKLNYCSIVQMHWSIQRCSSDNRLQKMANLCSSVVEKRKEKYMLQNVFLPKHCPWPDPVLSLIEKCKSLVLQIYNLGEVCDLSQWFTKWDFCRPHVAIWGEKKERQETIDFPERKSNLSFRLQNTFW